MVTLRKTTTTIRQGTMAPDNRRPGEITTAEAAEYCGYSLRYFYKRVKLIRHRKEGRGLYFAVADLDAFIADRSTTHEPTLEVA